MKIRAQERSQSFTSSSASSEIHPSQKEGWTVFSSVSSRVVPNKDLRRVGCMLHHQICTLVLINAAGIQLSQRKWHKSLRDVTSHLIFQSSIKEHQSGSNFKFYSRPNPICNSLLLSSHILHPLFDLILVDFSYWTSRFLFVWYKLLSAAFSRAGMEWLTWPYLSPNTALAHFHCYSPPHLFLLVSIPGPPPSPSLSTPSSLLALSSASIYFDLICLESCFLPVRSYKSHSPRRLLRDLNGRCWLRW